MRFARENCREIIQLSPGPHPLQEPEVEHYFKAMSNQLQLGQGKSWSIGGGLYAAIDPLQSGKFAQGEAWMLLKIKVPEKMRYLDSRPARVQEIVLRITHDTKLSQEFYQFLKREKIMLIAFEWDVSAFAECRSALPLPQQKIAFSFPNPDAFQKLEINFFSSELETKPSAEKKSAYAEILALGRVANWKLNTQGEPQKARDLVQGQFSANVLTEAWAKYLHSYPSVFDREKLKRQLQKLKAETFACSSLHGEEWTFPQ